MGIFPALKWAIEKFLQNRQRISLFGDIQMDFNWTIRDILIIFLLNLRLKINLLECLLSLCQKLSKLKNSNS